MAGGAHPAWAVPVRGGPWDRAGDGLHDDARDSRWWLMATMRYEFRVDGRLSDISRAAFVGMRVTETPPQTIIDGEVVDESHLHGIIAQLLTLGVAVVSVHPAPG